MEEKQAGQPDRHEQKAVATEGQTPLEVFDLVAVKLTDVGRARPHNEDYVDYYTPSDPQQLAEKGSLYLVADGMGGHQAGEVASEGAVKLVISNYYGDSHQGSAASLVQAFHEANQQLHNQSETDPSKKGMGTTLVAAAIQGRKVYLANVGDSRAYLVNSSGITQITEDHSWVEEQVRAGLLTPDQARRHPQRNLVTRALGSRSHVEVDLFEGEISEGDALLLCSDGLTGRVEDPEIEAMVKDHPPHDAVRELVALANERGGTDNITVLLIGTRKETDTPRTGSTAPFTRESATRSRVLPILLGVLAILALALGIFLAWRYLPWGQATVPPTSIPVDSTATAVPTPATQSLDRALDPRTGKSPTSQHSALAMGMASSTANVPAPADPPPESLSVFGPTDSYRISLASSPVGQ